MLCTWDHRVHGKPWRARAQALGWSETRDRQHVKPWRVQGLRPCGLKPSIISQALKGKGLGP
eukprot:2900561-Amphidinium_carterae.1